MPASQRLEGSRIPAGEGRWFALCSGQSLSVSLPEGPQVADLWAFRSNDPSEYLSVEHSRLLWGHLDPVPGDMLVTNHRRPMLLLTADDSGGAHDTLLPACDQARYTLLGASTEHRNCAANLAAAQRCAGIPAFQPNPFNLFENVSFDGSGRFTIEPPLAGKGASIQFDCLADAIVVLSACPQDLLPTNGADQTPRPVDIRVSRQT